MAHVVQAAENRKVVATEWYANQICERIIAQMPEIYITRVEVVNNNKYSHAAYQLRKAHFQLLHGYSSPTEDLYHATASGNVPSILKDNLDWRRVKRSRFGVGVSFSKCPKYANKFCNENNGSLRAFLVCEVLTGNVLRVGQNYSNYPRSHIDTYQSKSGLVIVKFEDNSFYPKYVIYYQTTPPEPHRPLSTYIESDFENPYANFDHLLTRINFQLNDLVHRLSLS